MIEAEWDSTNRRMKWKRKHNQDGSETEEENENENEGVPLQRPRRESPDSNENMSKFSDLLKDYLKCT